MIGFELLLHRYETKDLIQLSTPIFLAFEDYELVTHIGDTVFSGYDVLT